MVASGQHVAVIGAGPAGLAAIKSLLEEGFQVTGFERRPDAGGVWSFSPKSDITSVTTATRVQLSKFLTPFSDFPHTDDFPRHATGIELGKYYRAYASHFGLVEKIVFNATVSSIARDYASEKWLVSIEGEKQARPFDKVVYAIGSETVAKPPAIASLERFEGSFIHGQAYKRPQDFGGLNVVVVGQGNSAADCATELADHASKVYFAHRRGAVIVPRVVDGRRFDKFASWSATRLGYWIGSIWPSAHLWLLNSVFGSAMKKSWGELEPELRFEVKPEYVNNVPTLLLNDHLIPALRSGRIAGTHGVKRIHGPKSLEMDDGTILEGIDAIIACTGYRTPFEALGEAITFTKPHALVPPQPNLYQNVFALDYPDSLAFLNFLVASEHAAGVREVAGMAIAEVWAGKSKLPSREKMSLEIQKHQAWFTQRCLTQPVPQLEGLIDPSSWFPWIHGLAGTGVYEHLGWTWQGFVFSLTHPLLYLKMAHGVNTPHLLRYFDTGKRRAWPGALEAIYHVNEMSQRDLRTSKKAD